MCFRLLCCVLFGCGLGCCVGVVVVKGLRVLWFVLLCVVRLVLS